MRLFIHGHNQSIDNCHVKRIQINAYSTAVISSGYYCGAILIGFIGNIGGVCIGASRYASNIYYRNIAENKDFTSTMFSIKIASSGGMLLDNTNNNQNVNLMVFYY